MINKKSKCAKLAEKAPEGKYEITYKQCLMNQIVNEAFKRANTKCNKKESGNK